MTRSEWLLVPALLAPLTMTACGSNAGVVDAGPGPDTQPPIETGTGGTPADGGDTATTTPTVDCTTNTGDYCVSVTGTINGRSFDFACLPGNPDVISSRPTMLALTCHDPAKTLTFRVAFPEKGAGTFDFPAAATQAAVTDLEMLKVTDDVKSIQMSSQAGNLRDGSVHLVAGADGLRSGTFVGGWNQGAAGCKSFTYDCAEGAVNGSFRYRRSP